MSISEPHNGENPTTEPEKTPEANAAVEQTPVEPAPVEPAPAPKPSRKKKQPAAFTEAELAEVAQPPEGDPEVDELEPAKIEAEPAEIPVETMEQVISKGKRIGEKRLCNILEALLFVSAQPLTIDQLWETTGVDREKIQKALEKLQGVRREGVSGTVLVEVGGGWQLRTDPDASDYVRRFLKVKPQRLTRAAVETLAIIAYRQPVTRPEIEDIRGVDTGAVLKALLERRMIKILGKKEEVGRPILYGTTREFLEFFALKDLSSLPTLREFHELSQEHQEIVEKETPAPAAISGTVAELADPTFKAKLEAQSAASEAALAELEAAIDTADNTTKAATKLLQVDQPVDPNAPPPPAPSEPADDRG